MIRGGRRALFSSFGLGKTITQLEVMRVILNHEKGKALIVAPLAVVHVFQGDAQRLLGASLSGLIPRRSAAAVNWSILEG
jgi:hypothetical protein